MSGGEGESEPTREQLERIAFGRAETPEQEAAARDALEALVARDAALRQAQGPGPAQGPALGQSALPEAGVTEGGDPPETDAARVSARTRRPGSVIALLVVAGLFVGAGCGVLIAHAQANPGGALSIDSSGSTPTPVQSVSASASAALRSLLVPQTKADTEYPLTGTVTTLNIVPSSIHRILTVADGSTLWTSRTADAICLMWTAPSGGVGGAGGLECATPTGFSHGGLTLSEGTVTWTWDGTAFATYTGAGQ